MIILLHSLLLSQDSLLTSLVTYPECGNSSQSMDKIIACKTRRVSVEKIKELTWIIKIKKNEKGKKKKRTH